MLEWMHDEDVTKNLLANFATKTIEDCNDFIRNSEKDDPDLHMAVVNDRDEYMGTVSLKHISKQEGTAEFAITVRRSAMGQGFSSWGMAEILRVGMQEKGLQAIYWCVSKDNTRAVRFYDKNGYRRTTEVPERILMAYSQEMLQSFYWYVAVS